MSAEPSLRRGPPPLPRPEPLHALARASAPLLRGEEVRLCLAGPPGSGKSALLREFLPELQSAAARAGGAAGSSGRDGGLSLYFADGRPLGTAYLLLAALVRLAGGGAPATGWSRERLVEAWHSRAPEGTVVAVDHADEVEGIEELLRLLARRAPAPRGLLVAARSTSPLARGWGVAVPVGPPEGHPEPPPPQFRLEGGLDPAGGDPTWGLCPEAGVGSGGLGPEEGAGSGEGPDREEGSNREGGPGPAGGRASPSPRLPLLDDAPRLLLLLLAREGRPVPTGRLWRNYGRAAPEAGLRPLTLRRVSGLLRELEEGGWVSAPVVSRGRRGRTKWPSLTDEAREALREEGKRPLAEPDATAPSAP